MSAKQKKRVVVIGGGTGTYTVLQGLKAYVDSIDITAIVTMADSGGSTGRLRDEFGQLPVGDVRMALCALADDVDTHGDLLRELFLYRFDKGTGLAGHNFGNLFLTALTDIVGDTSRAIETAGQILRVQGSVIPVTTNNVQLVATYSSGETVVGEHNIDVSAPEFIRKRIIALQASPVAVINPKAEAAILNADIIVLGPGDLYTSILANCVVDGVALALQQTSAKIIFVSNIMSRAGQTINMELTDYISEIEKYIERAPDISFYNTAKINSELLDKYRAEGNHVVENCRCDIRYVVRGVDLVSHEKIISSAGDTVVRSLVRHDSGKLAKEIMMYAQIITGN